MKIFAFFVTVVLLPVLSGCSILQHKNASWNEKIEGEPKPTKASFDVHPRGRFIDTLFVIASSGGGSRAAVFTANVLLKLESTLVSNGSDNSNLLSEVDAISAVSGGALPTAYYAIAQAQGEVCQNGNPDASARQMWNEEELRKLMSQNFQIQWLGRWFLPQNIIRFWFTSFDRSDIMTQVFANSLYDRKYELGTYTFGEICDDRPNIILNATNGTSSTLQNVSVVRCPNDSDGEGFGSLFAFTDCEFRRLGSDINEYPIANAVMSSSAFPAVFNYTSLRNFALQEQNRVENAYLHLFDGGNHDNLGLQSAWHVIKKNGHKFKRIAVLLIDSYTKPKGVADTSPEARTGFDYLVDSNFFDSVDSLLSKNRSATISNFEEDLVALKKERSDLTTFFYHLTFDLIPDEKRRDSVNSIRTSFRIDPNDANNLELAVADLLANDNQCFIALQEFVTGQPISAPACVEVHAD